jgi:Transglycosylase-like domain
MAGRHRRPSQNSLRLARVGALTVMATAPLAAVTGTALAAPSPAPEPESSRWADPADDEWATWDDDTADESDDDATTTAAARSDDRGSHGPDARSVKPARGDETRGHHATLSRHDDSWDHRAAHARSATARSSGSAARSSAPGARADSPAVGSRVQDVKWDRLAQCESGQNWDANTGNSYRGGLQFSDSTWRAYGGRQYAPTADQATREQQIAVARKVQQAQGWEAWPSCSRRLGYA